MKVITFRLINWNNISIRAADWVNKSNKEKLISYLLYTYDLYGPVRNAFDAGSIHFAGKWEGVGPWKSRLFGPCEMASSR